MKNLTFILGVWCLLALGLAGYKITHEYNLDRSWQAYADQWVRDHE